MLQSYVNEIQAIKNTDYGAFDSLQIQEYANALSNVNGEQAALLLSTQGISNAEIQQILATQGLSTAKQAHAMATAGLLKTTASLNNVEMQSVLTKILSKECSEAVAAEKAKEAMAGMGLAAVIEGEEAQTVQLTAKKLQQAVATGLLTQAQAEEFAVLTGVMLAQNTQTATTMPKWIASMKSMIAVTWMEVKATAAWLTANPAGWIMAIAAAAGIGITAYNKYTEKQAQAFEDAKESAESYKSTIDSMNKEIKENSAQAKEIAESYAKLSQGVDTDTNKNLKLSNSDYERFLDLNSQLAELFPSLTKDYDNNGNAILGLGGSVETVTEKIASLVEQQERLAKAEIKDNLKGYVEGDEENGGQLDVIKGNKKKWKKAEEERDKYNYFNKILNGEKVSSQVLGIGEMDKIFKSAGLGQNDYNLIDGYWDISNLEPKELKKLKSTFDIFYSDLVNSVEEAKAELDSSNQDLSSQMMVWVEDLSVYADGDNTLQNTISNMVSSIEWDDLGITDYSGMQDYIRQNILTPISMALDDPASKERVSNALTGLFNIDFSQVSAKKTKESVDAYLTTIMDAINAGLDDDSPKKTLSDMYELFGMADYKNSLDTLDYSIKSDARTGSVSDTIYDIRTLTEYTEGFNLSQIETWLTVTNGIVGADNKIRAYEESLKRTASASEGITSLSDLLTEDENQKLDSLTGKMSSLGEAYQKLTTGSYSSSDILQLAQDFGITADNAEDLAELVKNKLNKQINRSIHEINELEAGTDDPEVLQQLETVKKALIGIGNEAKTAKGEVDAALRIQVASDIDTDDTLNALDDIKPAISSLGTLYDEYQDKDTKTFSLDAIANLNTELGELDLSSYKEFMEYLNETGNKADKADGKLQELFNNIISEYIGASGILDTVTDDNKNVVENILKQWGVLNAGEIVSQAAEANRQYEEEYKIVNENEYEVNGEKVKGLKGLYEEYYNALLAGDYETMDEIESIADGLINELSGSYQTDLENWKDLLVKKKEAYETFDKELNKRMGDDYDPDKSAEENVDAYIAAHPNLSPMDIASLERDAKIYDADIETSKNAVDKKEGTGKYKKNKGKGEFNLSNIKLSQSDSSKNKDKSSSSDKENNTEIDWLSRYTDVVSKKIDRLKAKYENLFTVKAKNNNLDKQLKNTEKLIKAQTKAIDIYKTKADSVANSKDGKKYLSGDDNLLSKIQNGQINGEHRGLVKKYGENAAKQIEEYQKWWDKYIEAKIARQNQKREKRAIQEQQYQNYVDDAQAKIDKSDALIELNSGNSKKQNNQLDNQKEYLKDSYKYQIKIAELNGEIIKAEQLKLELKQKLRDIEKQKFDNIQNQYSNEISLLENAGNKLSNEASLLEARGAVVTTDIYTNQIKNQQEIKTALQEEKVALQKQLATIKDGTDAWYEAKNALDDVDSEIDSCNTSIVEMYNNITELSRNIYDNLISAFHSVTDEADFVASLMSNRNMFNNEDGQITDEGLATLGTYVSGYYTSMQTADKIGDVIVLFDKELEKAKSYDFTNPEKPWHFFNPLTNSDEYFSSYKEMESYKEKLYQGQREEISKTYEYENKVIDMVKKNLESELSIMQKLVDSKKDALQATKDLHDYEKTIANSTKNISSIQKQIAALQGDNSEEGRARVQKLQKELEDAQEDLKETEYEHLISAQQDMLDNLIDEYETALNEEMSDVEHLLKKGIGMTNDGLDTINDTIDKYCNNYDYKLENIDDLYSNTGSIDNNVAKILDEIKNDAQNNGNTVTNNVDTVLDNLKKGNETLLNNVKGAVDNLLSDNKDKDIITEEFAVISNKTNEDTIGSFMETNGRSVKKDKYENVSKRYQNAVNEKLFEKYKKYLSLEKLGELAIDTLGISSKKSNDFSADGALYKELSKLVGFKHGGIAKFVKAHGEDGIAMVRNGEGILTPQMADTFTYDLIPRMDDIINASKILADIPAMTETTAIGNIEANFAFNLENVRDANDLIQQMQTNQNVRKAMQEVTIKQLTSSGTRLGVNSYH